MNMASIYPNGLEKSKDATKRVARKPELKARALEMVARGIRVMMISEKIGVNRATIAGWIRDSN